MSQATAKCMSQRAYSDGAIVYLATRAEDADALVKTVVPALWQHWLQRMRHPLVVFVPSPSLRRYDPRSFGLAANATDLRQRLLAGTGLPQDYPLTVAEFDLRAPEKLHFTPSWQSPTKWYNGYLHMNTFFTKVMFEAPALVPHRYYMRLDTDTKFTGDVGADPFCVMREMGKKFMWQDRRYEKYAYSDGMGAWMQSYAKSHRLTPKNPEVWLEGQPQDEPLKTLDLSWIYKGYVGMGDLEFFRSPQVQALAQAFNEDGGIYLHRWSDQTYYVQALALFEPASVVADLPLDLPLCHKCPDKS